MRISLLAVVCYLCMVSFALAGEANLFNPYMHKNLPSGSLKGENAEMAQSLGGEASSLQSEVKYRKYWRQEAYPVVFGNAMAAHEVLVFLDYALPQSQNLWSQVVQASKRMDPQQVKIVVFGKSTEPYGTELMGGGIWLAYTHPSAAMDYFTYTLQSWNAVKAALKAQGKSRTFVSEYDATTGPELPILYSYFDRIKHLVPVNQHFSIVKYAFDAGNVNMFQASMAAKEYDAANLPAVVVNGELVNGVSAQKILDALR